MNWAAMFLFLAALIFSENAFGWDAKTLYMYFHEVKPTPKECLNAAEHGEEVLNGQYILYDARYYELWIDTWSNSDPQEAFRMHCKALELTKDGSEIRLIYKRK